MIMSGTTPENTVDLVNETIQELEAHSAELLAEKQRLIRIAPEITSYFWKFYEHPDMGIAL